MGSGDLTSLPSLVLGGGSMLGVIVYLLRYMTVLQRQLLDVQAAASTRADERSAAAEAEIARLRERNQALEERLSATVESGRSRRRDQQRRQQEDGGDASSSA